MRTPAFVAGAVLAALAIAWLALDRRQPRAAAGGDDTRDELAELRAETARLRAAVSALERARSTPPGLEHPSADGPPAAALVTAKPPPPPSAHAEPLPPDPERERADTLRYARFLDDHLARTPGTDGAALVGSLKADIEGVLEEDATLLDVRCGADMCRVETKHQSGDAYRAFQARGFRQGEPLWPGPTTFILLEKPAAADAPLVAVMYLGRKDALPSPEASL